MATRKAELEIAIKGEQQFKAALADLNKGSQVLASELKKVSEQYRGNEKSIEALTAKNDVLQRQLLQQRDKVQTLRDALKNAATQFGEADKRTQEWRIKLNNAETAQIKLERAIEENNAEIRSQGQEMDAAGEKTGKLGEQVDEVAGKFGVNLPDGVKKALNSIDGFSVGSVAKIGAVAAAVAAVIKVARELNDLTTEAAGRADDLLTKSTTTGLSTTQLQQMRYAAPFIDVDESTLTGAMGRIPRVLAQAAEQMEAYNEAAAKAAREGKELTATLGSQAEALQRLGISATDANGQLRDSRDVSWEILEALGQVQNQTEADALANDIFGKSYADLKPLIQNADEAQRLYNEAIESGYVLSEEQLKILGEVDDAKQADILTTEAMTNAVAVQWAPAAKAAYEEHARLVKMAGQALVDSKLVDNLAGAVNATIALLDAGTNLINALPAWANPIQNLSTQLNMLGMVLAVIADYVDLISGLQPWNWGEGKVKQAIGLGYRSGNANNRQRWAMAQAGTLDQYDSFYGRNAAGDQNWRGGLTWVGESGPELVALPGGSRIYSNQESRSMGGDVWNITIDARSVQEFNDIVRLAKAARVERRMK